MILNTLNNQDVRELLVRRIIESERVPIGEGTFDGQAHGLRYALELVDVAVRCEEEGGPVEQRTAPVIMVDPAVTVRRS